MARKTYSAFLFGGAVVGWLALAAFPVLVIGYRTMSADPTIAPGTGYFWTYGGVAAGAGVLAVILNGWLLSRLGRVHLFRTILVCALALATIYGAEGVARLFAPAWPARGLHGVAPALVRAGQADAGARINDWGQRDRPRQTSPAAGISRVVFIGDSFLEETGGRDPVSVAVEDRLKGGGVETVNLGVSATAPDEYYWRLKNIALALAPERIVVFLYAVNDWIRRPTLPSFHGIASPYPRDSALETLGLAAINHFLMGDRRPYLRAWFGRAEGLRATEDARFDEIRRTPDAHMPLYLARNFIGRKFRDRAVKFLETVKPQAFYAGLRNPDAGRFRSYYLTWAMKFLGFANRPFAKVATGHVRYVAALLEAMRALCAARGVGFTVVVVPEASQVDPQFRKFWAQISSLHMGLLYTRTTSRALSERAGAAGIEILDLHEALAGVPGTYLNLDGHWSKKGVDVTADIIAGYLRAGRAPDPAKPEKP